jgi:hypothetical protein
MRGVNGVDLQYPLLYYPRRFRGVASPPGLGTKVFSPPRQHLLRPLPPASPGSSREESLGLLAYKKMNSLKLVCAMALLGAVLVSQSATGAAVAPKFSSAYTDLKTRCKAIAKGVAQGDDMPLRCVGFGGYELRIDYSAASSHLGVQPTAGGSEDRIVLAEQPLDYNLKRRVEWRLAGGKPFAVILRVQKAKGSADPAEMWRPENKTGESLLVKGLKGYERIDFEVDAASPGANEKAREMADKAYTGGH